MSEQRVLSIVEKGWAGARQYSIQLAGRGMRVEHLVKGRIAPEVLQMVTPYPGMRITGIGRRWYRCVVWLRLALAAGHPSLIMVLVDSPRAGAWVIRWFPALREKVVLVQERLDGSPILSTPGVQGNGAPQAAGALI